VRKSTQKTKRRLAKPKGRSPVIAGRVPESLHQQIREAAKRSGRSMSEELAWRAAMSFEIERVAEDELEGAMRRKGWRRVHGTSFWAPPGVLPKSGFVSIDEANTPLEQVIALTVRRVLDELKAA
jgi:hypothetical protein